MDQIKWCLEQKKGIELIEPSENLREGYIIKAEEDFNLIKKAFQARNNAQYYINREISDKNYELIIKSTPLFLVKCKNIILEEKEIREIRNKIKMYPTII